MPATVHLWGKSDTMLTQLPLFAQLLLQLHGHEIRPTGWRFTGRLLCSLRANSRRATLVFASRWNEQNDPVARTQTSQARIQDSEDYSSIPNGCQSAMSRSNQGRVLCSGLCLNCWNEYYYKDSLFM